MSSNITTSPPPMLNYIFQANLLCVVCLVCQAKDSLPERNVFPPDAAETQHLSPPCSNPFPAYESWPAAKGPQPAAPPLVKKPAKSEGLGGAAAAGGSEEEKEVEVEQDEGEATPDGNKRLLADILSVRIWKELFILGNETTTGLKVVRFSYLPCVRSDVKGRCASQEYLAQSSPPPLQKMVPSFLDSSFRQALWWWIVNDHGPKRGGKGNTFTFKSCGGCPPIVVADEKCYVGVDETRVNVEGRRTATRRR